MNVPPAQSVRVPADAMRQFIRTLMMTSGLEASKSALLADMLVGNDLRGVFSHGSRQAATYSGLIADGKLNGKPNVRCVSESDATASFDGDGGLGYFPSYEAAKWVVEPAHKYGIAVALTRNHGHFGAAGLYSRMVVANDLIAYVTSGHQLIVEPGDSVQAAAGGSPMSFGIPGGSEPPLILDFGTTIDIYPGMPYVPALLALAPGLVLRNVGLGMVCQVLGGFLAGVPLNEERAVKDFSGANQGSLIVAIDPTRFLPLAQLKDEMDRYHALVHQLQPMTPTLAPALPGTPEVLREQAYAVEGIPVGVNHREVLEEAARRFGVATPFPAVAQ